MSRTSLWRLDHRASRILAAPAARPSGERAQRAGYFTGMGVARSTGTVVTLFCGEPSITRSE